MRSRNAQVARTGRGDARGPRHVTGVHERERRERHRPATDGCCRRPARHGLRRRRRCRGCGADRGRSRSADTRWSRHRRSVGGRSTHRGGRRCRRCRRCRVRRGRADRSRIRRGRRGWRGRAVRARGPARRCRGCRRGGRCRRRARPGPEGVGGARRPRVRGRARRSRDRCCRPGAPAACGESRGSDVLRTRAPRAPDADRLRGTESSWQGRWPAGPGRQAERHRSEGRSRHRTVAASGGGDRRCCAGRGDTRCGTGDLGGQRRAADLSRRGRGALARLPTDRRRGLRHGGRRRRSGRRGRSRWRWR